MRARGGRQNPSAKFRIWAPLAQKVARPHPGLLPQEKVTYPPTIDNCDDGFGRKVQDEFRRCREKKFLFRWFEGREMA
jgi:hypothetical protein